MKAVETNLLKFMQGTEDELKVKRSDAAPLFLFAWMVYWKKGEQGDCLISSSLN